MARGDNITTTVPSVGDAETGGTSDILTILTALVAIAETQVSAAEINMDATLDMNSQAAENIKYLEFVTQGTTPTLTETLFTKTVTRDELHYKDSSGSVIQITSNGALNVSATGAITGAGYGSGGVEVNWNSGGSQYLMKSGSGADDYADVICDDVLLRDGSSHAVTLTAQSMAADYTLTFPAAVGAGVVTVDGSGNLAFTTEISGNLTWTGTQQFDNTVQMDGAVTIGNSLTIEAGNTTTLDDVALQTGAAVDLSGDVTSYVNFGTYLTNIRHDEIVRMIPPGAGWHGSSVSVNVSASQVSYTTPNGTSTFYSNIPLPVREGERITEIQCYVSAESLDNNATWGLYTQDGTGSSWSAVSGGTATISTTGLQTITLGTPEVVADFFCYAIRVIPASATGSLTITAFEFTTDKIA